MMRDTPDLQTAQLLLALTTVRGVRNRKALQLLEKYTSRDGAMDARDLFSAAVEEVRGYPDGFAKSWNDTERRLSDSEAAGVHILHYFDERYPRRLKEIADPPVVLFVKGPLECLQHPRSVAIVGTRDPSGFGAGRAYRAGSLAAGMDAVVVSGLALGCDTQAHEGCLSNGGAGIAVLAHGLERVYPAPNRYLADRLLECGGCLVSEFPVGVKPTRWAFAYRDRIQSGLSDRVLVIETDLKGGTMHTVRFSREQGRPLACIEHPSTLLDLPQARGNRRLIEEGVAAGIGDDVTLTCFLEGSQYSHGPGTTVESRPDSEQMRMDL